MKIYEAKIRQKIIRYLFGCAAFMYLLAGIILIIIGIVDGYLYVALALLAFYILCLCWAKKIIINGDEVVFITTIFSIHTTKDQISSAKFGTVPQKRYMAILKSLPPPVTTCRIAFRNRHRIIVFGSGIKNFEELVNIWGSQVAG